MGIVKGLLTLCVFSVLMFLTIVSMAVLGCRKEGKAEPRRREVFLPGTFQPGTVDEAAAIALARRCVSKQ